MCPLLVVLVIKKYFILEPGQRECNANLLSFPVHKVQSVNKRRPLRKWIVSKPTCLNNIFLKVSLYVSHKGIDIGYNCWVDIIVELTYFRPQTNLLMEQVIKLVSFDL